MTKAITGQVAQPVRFEELTREEVVSYVKGGILSKVGSKVFRAARHWEYRANEVTNKFCSFSEEEQLDAVEQMAKFDDLLMAPKMYGHMMQRMPLPRTNRDGYLLPGESSLEQRQRYILEKVVGELLD